MTRSKKYSSIYQSRETIKKTLVVIQGFFYLVNFVFYNGIGFIVSTARTYLGRSFPSMNMTTFGTNSFHFFSLISECFISYFIVKFLISFCMMFFCSRDSIDSCSYFRISFFKSNFCKFRIHAIIFMSFSSNCISKVI